MVDQKKFILTRTPFRFSFAGGGTDIPDFYRNHGPGAIVSGAMNRYVYINVKDYFFENSVRVHYSKVENDVTNVNEIQHPLMRECLKYLGITKGVELSSVADIPSKGTGLGSSSAFTVGLLKGLHAWKGEEIDPKQLAEEAIHIERVILKEAGGKQDQYVPAFGGLLLMEFNRDDTVNVKKVEMGKNEFNDLEKHLLMMYTGKERSSSAIHTKQATGVADHIDDYKKMVELAYKQYDALQNGKWQETGKLLHENWMLKKKLADGISDTYLDRLYNTALENGAEGGKIMGAGGGGFFMFFADPDKHQKIIEALPELRPEPFSFEMEGSKAVYAQGL